jgi:Raf kinase inhibitor-like YbhB/YbcL family protein
VWNIPPKTSKLLVGQKGFSQGTNDLGVLGYFGPCPPSGTHRYYFSLYALDSQVDLSTKSKRKDLQTNIQSHIIQKATLLGKYSRS